MVILTSSFTLFGAWLLRASFCENKAWLGKRVLKRLMSERSQAVNVYTTGGCLGSPNLEHISYTFMELSMHFDVSASGSVTMNGWIQILLFTLAIRNFQKYLLWTGVC